MGKSAHVLKYTILHHTHTHTHTFLSSYARINCAVRVGVGGLSPPLRRGQLQSNLVPPFSPSSDWTQLSLLVYKHTDVKTRDCFCPRLDIFGPLLRMTDDDADTRTWRVFSKSCFKVSSFTWSQSRLREIHVRWTRSGCYDSYRRDQIFSDFPWIIRVMRSFQAHVEVIEQTHAQLLQPASISEVDCRETHARWHTCGCV